MPSRPTLRYVHALAWTGLVVMCVALGYGFLAGDFWVDGKGLLENPWGLVTLIDIYVGFALFSGWVLWRESSLLVAVAWIAFIMILGNAAACLYVITVAIRCRSDAQRFWLGESPSDAR